MGKSEIDILAEELKEFYFDALGENNGRVFAYRATSPCDMKSAEQPVGELNEYWLEQSISSCKVVIVCWGGNGSHLNRHIEVNELLKKHANNTPILCFGKTKAGQPKHPLYLASNTELINYFN